MFIDPEVLIKHFFQDFNDPKQCHSQKWAITLSGASKNDLMIIKKKLKLNQGFAAENIF